MFNFNPKFLFVGKEKCDDVVYVQVAGDVSLYPRLSSFINMQTLGADTKINIVEIL